MLEAIECSEQSEYFAIEVAVFASDVVGDLDIDLLSQLAVQVSSVEVILLDVER